jgi:spore maturation protein CgeB
MELAFFGSSILSSYWNGAATYYRGLLRALAGLGWQVTFYEPDAYGRQENRDVEGFPWVRSMVYSGTNAADVERCLQEASAADVIVKASGVGVFDELLEERIAQLSPAKIAIFWDVDAPATLDRTLSNPADPFRRCIPKYDAIFTYGGGQKVVDAYLGLGARSCTPIYNAVDPETHYLVGAEEAFRCTLGFQGNRLPDREARVDEFFFRSAANVAEATFILGGNGWGDKPMTSNVKYIGHVPTQAHNAFNSSAQFVLNINRESMVSYGFSPPTRVFEAAAAGACLITDAWEGIEMFLKPGHEVFVAEDGNAVSEIIRTVSPEAAREIGEAARLRILSEHTYQQRALKVDLMLRELKEAHARQTAQRMYA